MSLTPVPLDSALLELAHSHHTIYEHSRMSGEHRRRLKVLPVDRADSCSEALESDYAHNMALYFGQPPEHPPLRHAHSVPLSRNERALDEALLLAAHSEHSIYEKTRLSGEQRKRKMLPTDRSAERADRCSDATDNSYANAMANFFVTKSSSRL